MLEFVGESHASVSQSQVQKVITAILHSLAHDAIIYFVIDLLCNSNDPSLIIGLEDVTKVFQYINPLKSA